MFLYEASENRDPILKEIDIQFMTIQKNPSAKNIKQLQNLVSQFTGIPRIIVIVSKEADSIVAGALPIYKSDFISDMKISFENAKQYIDKVYFLFGTTTIQRFTNRELTSILLHEIGHIYNHTTNLSFSFNRIFKKATFITSIFLTVLRATKIIPLLFILSRSIFIRDHSLEKASDDFATKYGYGDESIRVMSKLAGKKYNEPLMIEKVLDVFKDILLPNTHPDYRTRICRTIEKMIKEYAAMYPEISKDIQVILSEFKCKGHVT